MFLPSLLGSLKGYPICCTIPSKVSLPIFLLFFSVSLFSQYQNVVINEVSGDGGNIEARNDAIVELAGPPGTNIGCMVITNTEWAVVLPANTKIPADGVFLIGCEMGTNGGSGVYTGSQTGLSCSVCDFSGLVVDFDVCNPANANYISTSLYTTYGFTLDNGYCGRNTDGDQVILFRPDGTPHDGLYWGGPDNTSANGGSATLGGASGACGSNADHVSVQIGQAYLLGDNDDNGIVNDYTGTHIGFKADGNNATGVNIMPSGNDDLGNPILFGQSVSSPPGDCNANARKYIVPPLSDPVWVNAGLALVGCNSTHIRLNDSSPNGNSTQQIRPFTTSSHIDDPDLNPDWVSYTATDLVPSSVNPTLAAQQWQITNHPNPSLPNDVDTWDFFYDIGNGPIEITDATLLSIDLCEEQSITFTLQVYNYQHVEPLVMTSNKAGSFVQDEAGSIQSWNIQSVGSNNTVGSNSSNQDGITTFQYTTNTLSVGSANDFTLVWDDYTDCCGSGSIQTVLNQSNPNECYERIKIKATVGASFQTSQNHIDCPSDFEVGIGIIDIGNFVNPSNSNLHYTLKENTTIGQELNTGSTITTSTTGIFQLPNTSTPPIAITVEDPLGCAPAQVITIGADCKNTPPCPMLGTASFSTSFSNAILCQNEDFTLSLDVSASSDLPNGGQIDWHYGTDADFNPLDPTSTGYGDILPNPSTIATVAGCPSDGGNIFISELSDPLSGWQCHRYIEIYNGGPCSQNLTGWNLYAIGNNNQAIAFPLSGTIAVGQAMIASASCATDFAPDFIIPNGGNWNGVLSGNFNGQSRDGAELYDNMGNLIDIAVLNTANTNDWFTDNVAIRLPSICSGFTESTLCGTAATCSNLDNQWMIMAGATKSSPKMHSIDASACPTSTTTITITDATNSFDESFCNQTLYLKGVLNPSAISSTCTASNFITNTMSLSINCPEAELKIEDINLCTPVSDSEILASINLTEGSGSYDLSLEFIVEGNPITATYNNVTQPFQLTYSEIKNLLGSPVFSDVELNILSLADAAGNSCQGNIVSNNIYLTVQNSPTVNVFKGAELTDCTTNSGTIIFNIEPPNSGPWHIEYQLDNDGPILLSINESYLTLPINQAGIYEVISIVNEAGCKGAVISPSIQIIELPIDLNISASSTTLCDDSKTIHLDTAIIFNLHNNGILLQGDALTIGNISWYRNNPIGLPALIQQSLLLTEAEKIITPTASTDYYYLYQRPEDGCEVFGEVRIAVGGEYCESIPEAIEPTNTTSIPTMNQWGLWIFALLILNACLFFIRRLEQIKML